MEETFANGENIHIIEKSYTKQRNHTQNREIIHKSKIYKNGENSHKMEKTDTKWRKQTQNGENRHQLEIDIKSDFRSRDFEQFQAPTLTKC